MNVNILPKNVQNLRHWLTDEMGNLSNWHSTQSLIFGYDPNLSSWKYCWTTVNNSLHKSSTISQAKNSAGKATPHTKLFLCPHTDNVHKATQLTKLFLCRRTDNLHNSKVLTSLCKHCPLEKKSPKKQRNKQFNNYPVTQLQYNAKLKTTKLHFTLSIS